MASKETLQEYITPDGGIFVPKDVKLKPTFEINAGPASISPKEVPPEVRATFGTIDESKAPKIVRETLEAFRKKGEVVMPSTILLHTRMPDGTVHNVKVIPAPINPIQLF